MPCKATEYPQRGMGKATTNVQCYVAYFTGVCSMRSNCQINFGQGKGLRPNRRQTIARTNDDQDLLYHVAYLDRLWLI